MEIKKLQTSPIQQKVSSENTDASADQILQTGVGRIKDEFETISDELKLFADDEISSAQDSRDMFQIVDQETTRELGNQNSMRGYRRFSSKIRAEKDE